MTSIFLRATTELSILTFIHEQTRHVGRKDHLGGCEQNEVDVTR